MSETRLAELVALMRYQTAAGEPGVLGVLQYVGWLNLGSADTADNGEG